MWLFYGQNPASSAPKCTPTMGSQDGYHRADDESDIEQAAEHQPSGPQLPREPEREVDEPSRGQGEHHGEEVERREVPGRKEDAEGDGYGALEDHRARNVTQSQGVLAVPHPEGGVELLGQLGRQGRQYQGYEAGRQTEAPGGVLDRVDEDVGPRDDDPEARERLEDDGEERRVLAARQDQEPLRHLLQMPTGGERPSDVEAVAEGEHEGEGDLCVERQLYQPDARR